MLSKSFHREIGFSIKTMGPDSLFRAHFFYLETAFKGVIDSESGMIVNLTQVDEWLTSILHEYQGVTLEYLNGQWEQDFLFAELLRQIFEELESMVRSKGIADFALKHVVFREVRGKEVFAYDGHELSKSTQHFLENIEEHGSVWSLTFNWSMDLNHEELWSKTNLEREVVLFLKNHLHLNWKPDDIGLLLGLIRQRSDVKDQTSLPELKSLQLKELGGERCYLWI